MPGVMMCMPGLGAVTGTSLFGAGAFFMKKLLDKECTIVCSGSNTSRQAAMSQLSACTDKVLLRLARWSLSA